MTTGITFTFGGLKITNDAEVEDTTGHPIPGLFAAGEMVGGLFYHNYASGTGLMSGAVFGRLAGRNAAGATRKIPTPVSWQIHGRRKIDTQLNSSHFQIHPDLTISRLLNGMWQVSGAHGYIEPAGAIAEMFAYHDAGLTTWDLADHYGPAESL